MKTNKVTIEELIAEDREKEEDFWDLYDIDNIFEELELISAEELKREIKKHGGEL